MSLNKMCSMSLNKIKGLDALQGLRNSLPSGPQPSSEPKPSKPDKPSGSNGRPDTRGGNGQPPRPRQKPAYSSAAVTAFDELFKLWQVIDEAKRNGVVFPVPVEHRYLVCSAAIGRYAAAIQVDDARKQRRRRRRPKRSSSDEGHGRSE